MTRIETHPTCDRCTVPLPYTWLDRAQMAMSPTLYEAQGGRVCKQCFDDIANRHNEHLERAKQGDFSGLDLGGSFSIFSNG